MNKEFISVYQITKTIMFEIKYYTLSDNKEPYFSTSSMEFIRSKRDYKTCGQCQMDLLPKGSMARKFYNKWDKAHLQKLNNEELQELKNDVEKLKDIYNNIYIEKDTFKNMNSNFSFNDVVELSKKKLLK